MKNLFKSKKIQSFLLTMILVVSLFFFASCTSEDSYGEDGVYVKVVYRPYSTSRPGLLSKTYGEIAYDNCLTMSEDILTRLVGEYGMGEITVKDGDSTSTISPNLAENNYKDLLAIQESLTNEETFKLATDFSKTTNVYVVYSQKIMVLSNYAVNSSEINNIATFDTENNVYTSKVSLTKISLGRQELSSGAELTTNNVYKYTSGNNYAYLFIGEYVGSNISNNNFSSELNARNYLVKLLNCNVNAIQSSISGNFSLTESISNDLPRVSWTYALTQQEFSSCNSPEEYKENFIEKFKLSFAVHFANTILTRYEGVTLPEDLSSLFGQAKDLSSSNTSKENFIKACCVYIDHLGLLNEEITPLTQSIMQNVVGELIVQSNTNLAQNCANILNNTFLNYAGAPILEYRVYKSTETAEGLKVDGYLQSIIIIGDHDDYSFTDFIFDFKVDKSSSKLNYHFTLRHSYDGVVTEYPFAADENDFKDGTISAGVSDLDDGDKSSLELQKVAKISENKSAKNTLEDSNSYVYSSTTNNTKGYSWCYNTSNGSFVEIVFGSESMFSNFVIEEFDFVI